MEIGLYTFAELYADPSPGADQPAAAPRRPARGGRARRRARPRRLRRRRAPPPGLRGVGAGGRARRRRRADEADPPDERRHRAQLRRPGARVPGLRDARPALGRPRRDHGRARLVHRVVPALRLRPRATTTTLFDEKLELLLALRESERVTWQGAPPRRRWTTAASTRGRCRTRCRSGSRSAAHPESASRAGTLGLPMALAIIGGLPERFAPFVELYREAAGAAGHDPPPRAQHQLARLHRRDVAAGGRGVVPVRRRR